MPAKDNGVPVNVTNFWLSRSCTSRDRDSVDFLGTTMRRHGDLETLPRYQGRRNPRYSNFPI